MESAFRPEEWNKHTEALRRMARELLREEHKSEDLVQNAYLTALERPPRSVTRSWLAKVLQRRGLDSLRREARRRTREAPAEPKQSPDPEELALMLERHEAVVSALRALREPYSQALYLRYFDGLAPTEIAERLGVPVKTVKTRLHRGLQLMRERLERRYGPEAGGLHAALAPFALGQWVGMAPFAALPASTVVTGGVGIMLKKVAVLAVVLVLGAWGWRYLRVSGQEPMAPVSDASAEGNAESDQVAVAEEPEIAAPAPEDSRELAPRRDAEERPPEVQAVDRGAIVVEVVWPDREPAAGVAIGVRLRDPGLPSIAVRQSVSDANGNIRFDSLRSGAITLHSDRGGHEEAMIAAGEETHAVFELPKGVDVEGVVVDAQGAPVAQAEVWLATMYSDWMGQMPVASTDTGGAFRVRGVPPDISLGAMAKGFSPSELVDLDLVDTSEEPVEIRLELTKPGASLVGRVWAPDGQALEGARVCVGASSRHLSMRLGKGFAEQWGARSQVTDAEGRFRFDSLPPGTNPAAIAAAGHPIWRSEVTLEAGVETELVAHMQLGITVEGLVKDGEGQPVARAALRAFERAIDESFLQQGQYDYDGLMGYPAVVADEQGRYLLEAVAPGEVQLYASPAGSSRGKVRPYAHHVVHAEPGDAVTWNPVLSRGRTIEGRVTYKNGDVMDDVFVTARNESSGKRQTLRSERKTGRFEFLNLDDAPYSLGVQLWSPPEDAEPLEKRSVWPDQGEVLLVASFDKPVDETPGTVTGRVDDAAGRLQAETLAMILESDKRWWRTHCEIEGSEFTFPDVKPGRFVPVVLSGDDVVHVGDWFELKPGETYDVGTLVTRPGSSVTLRLLRGEGTEGVNATAYLRPENTIHSRRVAFGGESERRVENLSPGKYHVRLHGENMSSVFTDIVVEVGREETHELQLRAAVPRAIEIEYPAGAELGKLNVKITDASGEYDWEVTETNSGAIANPYSRSPYFPLGSFRLSAESGSGLSGSVEFEMLTLDVDQPPVRLTLK